MMPARTDRLHLEPYWIGDSIRAIKTAARMRVGSDGGRYVDINLQHALDGDICIHWGTAWKNGYLYIQVSRRRRRPMTQAELDRKISDWHTRDVVRWRRTRRRGLRFRSRVRPLRFLEMYDYARVRGVTPTFELKSNAYALRPVAQRLVTAAQRRGGRAYFMALISMPLCRQKCAAIRNAGGEFAVLAHDQPKPDDFGEWSPRPTRVWGRWA